MKRLLVLFTIFALLGLIAACVPAQPQVVEKEVVVTKEVEKIVKETVIVEVEKEAEPVATPRPEKPFAGTQVRVVSLEGLPAVKAMHDYFDPLYREYSGVDLVTDFPPSSDIYAYVFTRAQAGSDEYDVMWLDGPWYGVMTSLGALEPLNEYIKNQSDPEELALDDFPLRTLAYLSMTEGDPNTIWVIPNFHAVGMLAYRQDLFEDPQYQAEFKEKYGRDLAVPETWEEYLEVGQFFTRDTNGDGQIDLWGLNHRYGEAGQILGDLLLGFAYSRGAYMFDENWKPEMSSPEMLEAVKFYTSEEFLAVQPPGFESYQFSEVISNFQQGRVAMYLTENWAVPVLLDPEQNPLAASTAFAMVPGWKDPQTGEIHRGTMAGAGGYAINSKSKNKQAAFDYIQFVLSKSRAEGFSEQSGTSIRTSTYTDPELVAKYPYFPTNLAQLKVSIGRPQTAWWGEGMSIIGRALQDVVAGKESAEDAMKTADEQLEQLIDSYGVYKRGEKYLSLEEREARACQTLASLGIQHPECK